MVEIAPLKLEDLRNTQTGAPHDELRGARLVPAVDRQRVQQALDLVGREVMRDIHAWQSTPDELCQIRPCCHPVPPNDRRDQKAKSGRLVRKLCQHKLGGKIMTPVTANESRPHHSRGLNASSNGPTGPSWRKPRTGHPAQSHPTPCDDEAPVEGKQTADTQGLLENKTWQTCSGANSATGTHAQSAQLDRRQFTIQQSARWAKMSTLGRYDATEELAPPTRLSPNFPGYSRPLRCAIIAVITHLSSG